LQGFYIYAALHHGFDYNEKTNNVKLFCAPHQGALANKNQRLTKKMAKPARSLCDKQKA
jgi:hypothetical protein